MTTRAARQACWVERHRCHSLPRCSCKTSMRMRQGPTSARVEASSMTFAPYPSPWALTFFSRLFDQHDLRAKDTCFARECMRFDRFRAKQQARMASKWHRSLDAPNFGHRHRRSACTSSATRAGRSSLGYHRPRRSPGGYTRWIKPIGSAHSSSRSLKNTKEDVP